MPRWPSHATRRLMFIGSKELVSPAQLRVPCELTGLTPQQVGTPTCPAVAGNSRYLDVRSHTIEGARHQNFSSACFFLLPTWLLHRMQVNSRNRDPVDILQELTATSVKWLDEQAELSRTERRQRGGTRSGASSPRAGRVGRAGAGSGREGAATTAVPAVASQPERVGRNYQELAQNVSPISLG